MSLFVCDQCGHVENTALCYFWMREKGDPAYCSACDPRMGRWHGAFPRRKPTDEEYRSVRMIYPDGSVITQGGDDA